MISVTHFSPFESFLRRTWEFHDDKLVVRIKSLRMDYEHEIAYERIKKIQNRKLRELTGLVDAFVSVGLVGISTVIFSVLGIHSPLIPLIQKIVLVAAYLMIIAAFRMQEWYTLMDADGVYLASIGANRRNKRSLLEGLDLIRQKNPAVQTMYLTDPLPSSPPLFQVIEFDFADFLSKSTTSFYEDKLIDVERSMAEELVTVVNYEEFGDRPKMARSVNQHWDNMWGYLFILIAFIAATALVFFPEQLHGNIFFARTIIGGFLLLIPLFLLRYIKGDDLLFPGKNGNIMFGIRISRANRDEAKRAAAFVEAKIALNKRAG